MLPDKPSLTTSPAAYVIYVFARLCLGVVAFILPFVLVEAIAALLGEPSAPGIVVLGSYILFPALLSLLFHLAQHTVPLVRSSYLCYTGIFIFFSFVLVWNGLHANHLYNLLGGLFVLAIGGSMLYFAFWSIRRQRTRAPDTRTAAR